MFRVVPDQLKISEGWVRCGHCAEVFDATAHLAEEEVAQAFGGDTQPASLGDLPPAAASAADTGWTSDAAAPAAGAFAVETAAVPEAPPPAAVRPPAPAPAREPAIPVSRFGPDSQSLESSALDAPFVFRRSDFVEPDPMPSVLPPAPGDSRLPPEDDADAGLADVSFVRQARRKAFWRRPLVRLALTFFSMGLAGLLLLQVAYHDRDRLAEARPALRPALEQMCGVLRCTLGAPRQIEAIVIDSSGFNRLRGDNYRLSFSVRNTSPVRVAAPSLELTLTDGQDQALLRRVLSPAELGAAQGFIAGNAEWAGAVGMSVSPGSAGRVAGYRLLAFYP